MAPEAHSSAAAAPVTVVVPTYNRAHMVGAAIGSVLAQTYSNFALVVSDNASTDDTAAVVAQFDDPRLRYVRRERNIELNGHYNVVMAEVETPYMFVLPDDDLLHPKALATLLPVLERNPRAGIAHGRVRLVDEAGGVIHPAHDMTGLSQEAVEPGAIFIARAMRASHRVHASTVLYRSEAIKPVPLDRRDYPATEFGVWLRLALDWDLAFVPETVATYRIHANTYTSANARVTRGGYMQSADTIEKIRDVKLRFLADHGARLGDAGGLEREARRAMRAQLVDYAGRATLPERRIVATARVLLECARRDQRTLTEPGAWRLLAASLLGRRLVERIKRRRVARARLREVLGP